MVPLAGAVANPIQTESVLIFERVGANHGLLDRVAGKVADAGAKRHILGAGGMVEYGLETPSLTFHEGRDPCVAVIKRNLDNGPAHAGPAVQVVPINLDGHLEIGAPSRFSMPT